MKNEQQLVMDRGKLWAKYKQILVGLESQEKKSKETETCNIRISTAINFPLQSKSSM